VLDIGPGAGIHGGRIVAEGTPADIIRSRASITGQYLSGKRRIDVPTRRKSGRQFIRIRQARGNNLKSVDVKIPVGICTVVTGVSGSGKSTLVNDTLYKYAANLINNARHSPSPVKSITGLKVFDKIVDIDQSAIGRSPRSNPATYSGLFSPIRDLFAGTHEARSRGYKAGRFSFNVKGGRCEACQGDGLIKVEMHFLPDVYVSCDVCQGRRYGRETLDIRYKGQNIHQVLSMTVEQANGFFAPVPVLNRKLETLMDVGLSYISLGQNATTLSGGEAQRIKLARELSKRDTGNTLYILDEPTTGLHFEDVKALLGVLQRLRDAGNTIIIIEHNLDVIKTADWIIDMGPEGGQGGGTVVAAGSPEEIAACKTSYTGQYLKRLLAR
jgi:excinuclease ABC subunit A